MLSCLVSDLFLSDHASTHLDTVSNLTLIELKSGVEVCEYNDVSFPYKLETICIFYLF